MKILLVSNMYPDKNNPQFGVFVKNSEEVLTKNKFDVDKVVCTKKKSNLAKIVQYTFFYVKIFVKVLIGKYDYIYIHYLSYSSLTILIAKKLGKKLRVISNIHGSDLIPQNNKHKMLNNLAKKCAEISDILIVPSNHFKKETINRWNIVEDKIYIYPSGGVKNEIFKPKNSLNKCKEKLGLEKAYKYIGFVSRLESRKGWNILLEAINQLKGNSIIKDYRFIFVGNGSDEKEFKLKINTLNLTDLVIHFNFFNQNKLSDVYNCLELFCFPTEANESLGLVGIEALACGVPVIASNFSGPTDYIVDNYNGYLFKKGNYKDLSEKIQKYILLDREKKIKMSNSARESSKKYWSENAQKDLINIFNINEK